MSRFPSKCLLLLLCLTALRAPSFAATDGVVRGRVFCGDKGIKGVVVSDGAEVVKTDASGCYEIKTSLPLGYVFISVPSGYEVPSEGLLPQFFRQISEGGSAQADFELLKVDQRRCNLLVFNDVHLTDTKADQYDLKQFGSGFYPDVLEHARTLGEVPLYAICLGDMTTDSRWYKNHFALPEYLKQMEGFPAPVFHIMGNHDNDMRAGGGDFNSSSTFRKVIGPSYYSFNIGGFHFVCLDDIIYDNPLNDKGNVNKATEYHAYVDETQLKWLEKDLAAVKRNVPVVLCAHIPFTRLSGFSLGREEHKDAFNDGHTSAEVMNLLRFFKKVYILSGHTHENYYVLKDGVLEHNNIAVAGASWYTDCEIGRVLSRDGTPGGYSVYTIDGGRLSWYYKACGHSVEGCQFRAYDVNTLPEDARQGATANSVWVNVFNYDPAWKVEIFEKGKPLKVNRAYLKDPLYYEGMKDNPHTRRGAFMPRPTAHFFTATAGEADSTLEILVTDRFGRKFSQSMIRPKPFSLDMPLGNSNN